MMHSLNSRRHTNALQTLVFLPQSLARFDKLWVDGDARHGADLHTLWFVKVAYTLGAFVRVNLVNLFAQVNSLVGDIRVRTHRS